MGERIVVVGHGSVTCLGRDMDATWDGLVAGRSGLARHAAFGADAFLQDVAGVVADFGPGTPGEDPAVSRLPARSIHLALAAARSAWADAGLGEGVPFDPDRVALAVGSALGGLDLLEAEAEPLGRGVGATRPDPYLIPGLIINQSGGAGRPASWAVRGPSLAPANACASGGSRASRWAALLLRAGEADVAICRGGRERVHAGGHQRLRHDAGPLPPGSRDDRARPMTPPCPAGRSAWTGPASSSRKGSGDARAGHGGGGPAAGASRLQAEVAGLVDEHGRTPYRHARRGDRVARWRSGRGNEPSAGLQPARAGRLLQRPRDKHVRPTTGSRPPAIKAVVRATTPGGCRSARSRGRWGTALGAASAIEAAACVRALMTQIIPPTINYLPDPELDLDFVPGLGRPAALETVVSASFGFGGTNNALVLRRWSDA